MLTPTINKKITQKNKSFNVKLLLLDFTSIFHRDLTEIRFDSAVYIWCFKSNKKTNLGGEINIKGIPYYIGFTKFAKWNDIASSRAFNHKNDLLEKTRKSGHICYCILGLSQKEAHCLEAHLINTLNFPLTKKGSTKHKRNTLVNKRRERKYENTNIFYPINEWK